MAKPTWIRTQSPGTGGSSSRSPKSTLRRTPTTSTTACCGFCKSISMIFPGIARHTVQLLCQLLFLLSGHEFKTELQLVLQPQRSTRKRKRLDSVIRLPEREFAGDSQHRSHTRDACIKGMGLRGPVKRKLAIHAGEK